jgi:hypothetical protein
VPANSGVFANNYAFANPAALQKTDRRIRQWLTTLINGMERDREKRVAFSILPRSSKNHLFYSFQGYGKLYKSNIQDPIF